MAARLVELRNLSPPIDVKSLVGEFADLIERPIPADIDIDGICLGLKRPGHRPVVVLNTGRPKNRQRFTLAHELGHILIPWHTGNIFDSTNIYDHEGAGEYWQIEAEANRFASELLMPSNWVKSAFKKQRSPHLLASEVARSAETSKIAATLKVLSCLPAGYAFAEIEGGLVTRSGKSPGTVANFPYPLTAQNSTSAFSWARQSWVNEDGSSKTIWWDLSFPEKLIKPPEKPWREILDDIISDCAPESQEKTLKATINGVISGANSQLKDRRSPEALVSSCLQRFYSRADSDPIYYSIVNHKNFESFLSARIIALFE